MTDTQLPPVVPSTIEQLRAVKLQLMSALQAVDVAIAQMGSCDLVLWAGSARHEQRCRRCGYWIFADDPVCAIAINETESFYAHRECVVRVANAEEGRPRG